MQRYHHWSLVLHAMEVAVYCLLFTATATGQTIKPKLVPAGSSRAAANGWLARLPSTITTSKSSREAAPDSLP